MKRLLLFFGFLLTLAGSASAQISETEALNRAGEFIKKNRGALSGRLAAPQRQGALKVGRINDGLYVVSAQDGGFIVVANSNHTEPVLAYGFDEPFSLTDMPDNVRAWMTNVGRLVEQANKAGAQDSPRRNVAVTVKAPIAPMTSTKWNQGTISSVDGNAFNWDCPNYVYSSGDTRHCLTGCVATAMAQLMYYHKWPKAATTAVPSYTSNSSIGTLAALPATTFAWDDMLDEYKGTDLSDVSGNAAKAVGTLMRYCGQGAKMNYGTGGSSASTAEALNALISYFGYNPNAYFASRNSYTNTAWENLIYTELQNNRPVLYSGQSTGGGHAFLCDGYDGEGLYHINWGWGGSYNGYFSLSVLNSDSNDGAGASSTEDGYSFMQDALIGVQPETIEKEQAATGLSVADVQYDGTTLSMHLANYTDQELGTVFYRIGVVDAQGTVTQLISMYSTNAAGLPSGWYYSPSVTADNLAASLADGTYVITGVQTETNTADLSLWKPANGYEENYALVTIAGGAVTSVRTYPLTCDISVTKAEFTGDGFTGIQQEVKVSFLNNTNAEYSGTVVMVADDSKDYTNYTYASVATSVAGLYTYANGPGTAYYYFRPTFTGEHTLYFWEVKGNVCDRLLGTAKVSSVPQSGASGEFTAELNVDNLIESGGKNYLITEEFNAKVVLNNPTSAAVPVTYYYIMKGDNSAKGFSITVAAGSSYTNALTYQGQLTVGKEYTFLLTNGSPYGANPDIVASVTFTVAQGAKCYDAEGSLTFVPNEASMAIPADAAAVDLTNAGTTAATNITPNTNPNCIYFLASGQAVPNGLAGLNIVKGKTADVINLQQGYPFYAISNFTADAVSLTASFKGSKEDSKDGWSTLVLPFEADNVTSDGQPISWFQSADDTAKNFWLYQFSYEENGQAHFDYVDGTAIKANIPYIIAVPDDSYGSKWSLDGKDIVFSADITEFKADSKCSVTGQQLSMKGAYKAERITNGYVLNSEGNAFVAVSSDGATVDPFTAYFVTLGNVVSGAGMVSIVIGGDQQATGIRTPMCHAELESSANADAAWYSLSGQRVSHPEKGIYIHNGKKVLVK